MFGWFRKKPNPRPAASVGFMEDMIRADALSAGVSEAVKNYWTDVQKGIRTSPPHRRKNENVVSMWRDLRLEAMTRVFGFGKSDFSLLSRHPKQLAVLNCFLDERPHLEMPQPRGEVMADTVQSIWQVYVFLSTLGSDTADRECDPLTLKVKHKTILDTFSRDAVAARESWRNYERALQDRNGSIPTLPPTVLEFLFTDVTAKTKSLALSVIFGPKYEQNMDLLKVRVADAQERIEIEESFKSILIAKDPDHPLP